MNLRLTCLGAAALLATVATQAATSDVRTLKNTGAATASRSAQDYVHAKVLMPTVSQLPQAVFDLNAAAAVAARQSPKLFAGGRGGADASRLETVLDAATDRADAEGGVGIEAVGTGNLHFTSSRVSPKSLDKTYPVRAVGKLYFDIGSLRYMCTASLVKPGVVVTAGHCVHSGNGAASGWYTNFEFIPGYRKTGSKITQPYGSWTSWATAVTSTDWYNGGGSVPNAGDFAVIVFNADATGKRVGDYTGWLGWGYPLSIGRHNTVLGYPANLDLAGQLHRVDSGVTDYGSFGNGTIGSDMQGGSSGGPWVLNWRVDYSDSSTAPSENWGNIVTSVTSWGYVSSTPKVQGGTQFNATFANILNSACTSHPSAC